MSQFGVYGGEEFLKLELRKRDWLIESLIREKDSAMLVGNEKSGKSLLIFQLICSLTSQHPFIDKYEVMRPCNVSYIQLEGELEDSQDRMKRMLKVLDFEPSRFQLLFLPPIAMEEGHVIKKLIKDLAPHKPDIIIIDPIYFALNGSLSDDLAVRRFIGNIRILKDNLECAVILVHHTHKMRMNTKGEVINEGDDATFGSKFLKAYPDHTLLFVYDKNKCIRRLSCDTQRSGDIINATQLKLIEPDPLYFEEINQAPTKEALLLSILMKSKDGLNIDELMEFMGVSRNTLYNSLKKPLADKVVIKTTGRPVRYTMKGK